MSELRYVVVGGSAGALQPMLELAASLPARFPAAVLVVQHIGSYRSLLPELLSSRGPLRATHARGGERIEGGRVYVAPPDCHMLIEERSIALSRGPREHHTRPAIDPLFRSAALAAGPRVIGVVLSGHLDDGTAGLQAIKDHGGVAMVQDPQDAEVPSMPRSALQYVEVDHCVPIAGMAALLVSIVERDTDTPKSLSRDDWAQEQAVSRANGDSVQRLNAIGEPSTLTCPDCHGALWEIRASKPRRYRCHTGHAFTIRTLEHAQGAAADEALWSAIRALREKQLLLVEMATAAREAGNDAEVARLDASAQATERQYQLLRSLPETAPAVG